MPDEYDDAWSEIGQDFEEFCNEYTVTVKQVSPQDGSVLATAEGVPALKRVRVLSTANGTVGSEVERFVLRLSAIGFTPSARDVIVDEAGVSWDVDDAGVQVIGFGALVVCPVTLSRDDDV